MTEEDQIRLRAHVRRLIGQLHSRTLSHREKQLLATLHMCIQSLEHLDNLLTIVPPDLFVYPVEQFKQWQHAREVTKLARDVHLSVLGYEFSPREDE